MISVISRLNENGKIEKLAEYSLPAKKALICYIKQYIYKDFTTWTYPENIPGVRVLDNPARAYYDDGGGAVLGAYEYN